MKVYVLDKDMKPLMPTSRGGRVRWLLKNGRARVVRRIPFTIQLLEENRKYYTQEINLGIKPGSKELGLSATSEKEELFCASVKLRTDIVNLLSTRRETRKTRRSRLRYRKAKFLNRVKTKKPGWIAPSIRNKIQFHLKMVELVHKILPISNIILEIAIFDIQKIKNPGIQGSQYQEGPKKGFDGNTREYVLYRDNHECQCCHGKSGDPILNIHHIVTRKTGGNSPDNLVTLCKTCHSGIHNGTIKYTPKKSKSYRDVTYLNIVKNYLYKELLRRYGYVYMTYGFETKSNRISLGLPKESGVNAFVISGNLGSKVSDNIYQVKQIRRHNRQIHKSKILKGGRLKKNQADYKVFGYRLNDIIMYQGETYYIGGRRGTGHFNIRSLDGTKKLDISYKKLEFLYEARRLFMFNQRRNVTPIPPTTKVMGFLGVIS